MNYNFVFFDNVSPFPTSLPHHCSIFCLRESVFCLFVCLDSTHKCNCASFSVSPFQLIVTSSRFIYVVKTFLSFLGLNNISCVCISYSIHPLMNTQVIFILPCSLISDKMKGQKLKLEIWKNRLSTDCYKVFHYLKHYQKVAYTFLDTACCKMLSNTL